ncbi:hypothetical protein ADIAL_1000 [Alkalibacterium sp. AK22]|uniref:immunoglobulin-like domain-containing protein n=1 Tax=Alkalibacterium sp. AK22 TaxID=1229520 RepID=UPI0004464F88|nr:immunoglobulin-like domain-containing protein [Alkalibacterium sp. AK22]EXJ23563.1 hypothetical protein ADIAL_1000 [Alkalibacterium sp. AK22]
MINKLIRMVGLLTALIIASACGNTKEASPFEETDGLEGVSIELSEEVYARENDTFRLTVSNESETEITYGIAFTVEKQEGDNWYIVEPEEEMAFILIAHVLSPKEASEETLNMDYYEPFDEGKYRVVRQIEGEPLTAEFRVEE